MKNILGISGTIRELRSGKSRGLNHTICVHSSFAVSRSSARIFEADDHDQISFGNCNQNQAGVARISNYTVNTWDRIPSSIICKGIGMRLQVLIAPLYLTPNNGQTLAIHGHWVIDKIAQDMEK